METGGSESGLVLATSLASLVVINLVLSGDNAVVIGLAARQLPASLRRRAIVLGSIGAVALRVLFTAVAAYLLSIPLLQFGGGLILFWIAFRLLRPGDDQIGETALGHVSQWDAIQTIVVADVVMSLDNVLAIAGAARGDLLVLVVGLAISMPLIAIGGGLIAWLMDRFRWLAVVGSAVLAWTAATMCLDDALVAPYLDVLPRASISLPIVATVAVVAAGLWSRRHATT